MSETEFTEFRNEQDFDCLEFCLRKYSENFENSLILIQNKFSETAISEFQNKQDLNI